MTHPLRRLVLALIASACCWPAATQAAAPQPIVMGSQIVDRVTSKRLVPHGVDFPGFEYACQQGWSYGEKGTGPGQAAATAAAIARWKIDTVRLPLNQDCWLGDDDQPSGSLTVDGYRDAVAGFTEALNGAGIMVVLDLHWTGPEGVVADGLRPLPDSRSPAFWASVASRFKSNRSVVFDLFNEPHSRWNPGSLLFDLSWDCWAGGGCQAPVEPDTATASGGAFYTATGMKELVAAVRATGATQPILVSGIDYANDLRGWRAHAPADGQLIAGFHNYPGQRCGTVDCWNAEIAPLAGHVPVLAAELGQNDCVAPPAHVNRFMDWADDHEIGYLAWAWWVLPDLGCSDYALISDLDGTPLAPVGTAFHDHLAELSRRPDKPGAGDPDPDDATRPAAGPQRVLTVKRRPSGLRVRSAKWRRGVLRMRIGISPLASFSIRVRIRLTGPKARSRAISARLETETGLAILRRRLPPGTKPALITVGYPGDQRLRPKRLVLRPSSVSSLTRRARRG